MIAVVVVNFDALPLGSTLAVAALLPVAGRFVLSVMVLATALAALDLGPDFSFDSFLLLVFVVVVVCVFFALDRLLLLIFPVLALELFSLADDGATSSRVGEARCGEARWGEDGFLGV